MAILTRAIASTRAYPPLARPKHEAGRTVPYDLRMLVERSLHPSWLSNAYLLAAEEGGPRCSSTAAHRSSRSSRPSRAIGSTPTHLLLTHGHADHVAGNDELVERYGVEVTAGPVETGGLRIEALDMPGHSDDGISFVVDDAFCFTGATRCSATRSAVSCWSRTRESAMDVLMKLPPETRAFRATWTET